MNTLGREAWKSRVAKTAAWLAPAGVIAFALLSMSRIGLSTANATLLGAGGAQLLVMSLSGAIGRRIAAVEIVFLALLSLPFYFVSRETSAELLIPFWGRVVLFALGAVVLIYLAGVCLSDAKRLSNDRGPERTTTRASQPGSGPKVPVKR